MAMPIRQGATHKVVLGPFVDVGDGFTPETGVTLSGADEAEAILHDNGTVVDISGYTWAAITTADGYYHLTLQSGISNTVGHLTIVVQDDSVCLPVRGDFVVLDTLAYDAIYKDAAIMDVNVLTVAGGSQTSGDLAALITTVDTVVDGIQTDLDNGTDGLGAIKTDTAAILVDTGTTLDGRIPAALVGGRMDANVGAISADSGAADNLEAMYDGTGYTDDTAPSSRSQVAGIGTGSGSALNFPVSADNTAGAIIDSVTFVGSQTGTYANTESNLATNHQITHATNAFDLVYRIAAGDIRTVVSVTIDAYLNGSNDTASIQVYDHVGTDWETVATIDGTNGSTITQFAINLFEKHTGTLGTSEAGNCYLRFVTSGQSSPELYIARVSGSAVPATSTMGYESGQVWVDEDNGTSTGTTLGIDGVFANQSDDFDNAQDIADALGTSFIHVHPGNSITLSDALEGYVVNMVQATVTGGSQNVGSTRFNEGVFQGTFARSSGFPSFADGRIFGASGVSFPQFVAFRCSIVGTLTLSEAANQSLIDCQAGGTATIDCGSLGSGFILNLVRWTGNVTLNNLAASAVVNLNMVGGGDVVLNGADATVNIDGVISTLTNNLTGSPTVTDSAIYQASINAEADTALTDYDGIVLSDLGTPAGSDILADIAAVKAETAAIVNDTDVIDDGTSGLVKIASDVAAILVDTGTTLQNELDGIQADTEDLQAQIGTAGAGLTDLGGMSTGMKAEVNIEVDGAFTTQMADSVASDGTIATREQAMYMLLQFLTEFAISSTTYTVKKVDGSTTLFSLTLDDDTNPTSLTRS